MPARSITRRAALAMAVSAATSACVRCLMTNPADLSIEVSGFDADGVVLIPPTAPDFDALARPMVGRVADVALQLKPMLVILANRSARRIVAFSKAWRIQYADGRTLNSRDEQLFPES